MWYCKISNHLSVLQKNNDELDESTAHRHLKSPQSLSGRSLHLTLVTKWPRSHMTFKIQILIQGHGQGQTHWSYLRPRVQIDMFAFRFVAIGPVLVEIYKKFIFYLANSRSMSQPRSNPMVTLEAKSSIDVFAFCFVAIGPFLAEI